MLPLYRRNSIKPLDLTGERFGRLKVIGRESSKKRTYWRCLCDCGSIVIARTDLLRNGEIKSCSCLKKELIAKRFTVHGGSRSKLYYVWNTMKDRCRNINNKKAKDYLGRGITICSEWYDFENFSKWALNNGYSDNLTIDRIDNNKGYYPENCRWTDNVTQANNRRSNRRIEYNGVIKTLAQWARIYNINYNTLRNRLNRGWEFERAIA